MNSSFQSLQIMLLEEKAALRIARRIQRGASTEQAVALELNRAGVDGELTKEQAARLNGRV